MEITDEPEQPLAYPRRTREPEPEQNPPHPAPDARERSGNTIPPPVVGRGCSVLLARLCAIGVITPEAAQVIGNAKHSFAPSGPGLRSSGPNGNRRLQTQELPTEPDKAPAPLIEASGLSAARTKDSRTSGETRWLVKGNWAAYSCPEDS
jgi:hypothetical protein